jgi:hypothetical protein
MTINIKYKDWKDVFKQDIKNKLIISKQEYDIYKKTNQIVYLQQAGNKLFSVVENWLMLKYKTKVSNFQDLRNLTNNNKNDRRLLSKVARLHYFFYQGEIMGEPVEFADIYEEVYEIMKRRIK